MCVETAKCVLCVVQRCLLSVRHQLGHAYSPLSSREHCIYIFDVYEQRFRSSRCVRVECELGAGLLPAYVAQYGICDVYEG